MREFLDSRNGKIVAGTIIAVGLVAVFIAIRSSGASSTSAAARSAYFVCTETGKSFQYTLKMGDSIPVPSPYSGKNTGVMGELCYWTKEGGIKEEPTVVLLNSQIGKPEPTFCPDCGRLVVARNPGASKDRKPPPLQSEYKKRATDE